MRDTIIIAIFLALGAVACGPAGPTPTLAPTAGAPRALPPSPATDTPRVELAPTHTPEPSATSTPIPTETAEPTRTPQPTDTSPPPTDTPLPPTSTPSPTPIPPTNTPAPPPPTNTPAPSCDPSYPTVCIPPSPPDLDCGDIPYRRFQVLQPDPHRFDGDKNGIGCERI